MYNAGQSIGCILGPLFGSYIMLFSGSFRKTSDYFAIFTLAFAVLMFLVVYLPIKLKKKVKPKRKMTNQYLPVTSSGGDVDRMRKRILSEEIPPN
ncbi:hypothetical protein FGO68_gene15816 [Halteria grandinella]|uniref:Uncharacterized protein n=1 Tax=Halteria grandinella TaxID=5974 RepID=A0A8J8SV05_HALGN|nr:hypothetical protein FGO68_gene15816 [Halteria grandinella]